MSKDKHVRKIREIKHNWKIAVQVICRIFPTKFILWNLTYFLTSVDLTNILTDSILDVWLIFWLILIWRNFFFQNHYWVLTKSEYIFHLMSLGKGKIFDDWNKFAVLTSRSLDKPTTEGAVEKPKEQVSQPVGGGGRPGTTKRRQYYNKQVAPPFASPPKEDKVRHLYAFKMKLVMFNFLSVYY